MCQKSTGGSEDTTQGVKVPQSLTSVALLAKSEGVHDLFIDAILAIAANKEARKVLEPHIMQPLQLERWAVKLTLDIVDIILEELENGASPKDI